MESDLNPLKSAMLVYYWLKFLGLAPVSLKNDTFYPASILGKLYSIVTAIIYGLAMPAVYLMLPESTLGTNSNVTGSNNIINTVSLIVNYVTLGVIPILLLSIGKKTVHLLNDLRTTSSDLRNLGIVEDQGKFLKGLFVSAVRMNSFIVTTHIIMILIKPNRPLIRIMILLLKDLIMAGTILIFCQILIRVGQCFELLNNELCNGLEDPRTGNRARNIPLANLDRIEKLGALHLKLCDLVDRTAQLFSAPIFTCILLCFTILITFSCRVLAAILHPSQITNIEDYITFVRYQIMGSVVTMMTITFGLFVLLHVCVTTCNQGNAAKVTLFETWSKIHLAELKDEFGMFSLQMMYEPVTVSAFGFFDLDYTCLFKILGAVLAYSIVMIQSSQP